MRPALISHGCRRLLNFFPSTASLAADGQRRRSQVSFVAPPPAWISERAHHLSLLQLLAKAVHSGLAFRGLPAVAAATGSVVNVAFVLHFRMKWRAPSGSRSGGWGTDAKRNYGE